MLRNMKLGTKLLAVVLPPLLVLVAASLSLNFNFKRIADPRPECY